MIKKGSGFRRNNVMTCASDLCNQTLNSLLEEGIIKPEVKKLFWAEIKLREVFAQACGPHLSPHLRIDRLNGPVLWLQAENSIWVEQSRFFTDELLLRLKELLPWLKAEKIKVRNGEWSFERKS